MSIWVGKRRGWQWGAAGVALATAGAVGLILHGQAQPAPPHVDAALDRTVLPVVDHYVLTAPQGPLGGEMPAAGNGSAPRGFCTERVVEIRPAGAALRVGLVAWCGHFVRDGPRATPLDGVVTAGELTVSPASAPARVTAASWEPDDRFSTWAPAHFSAGGAAEAQRLLGDSAANLTDPADKARAAFGLSAPGAG
ncbi:hypothetical protein NMG29_11545 [Streptomyces cocklensis]|uniref:Uncharacterized protein n=1 Tax=Actinacidiphila cocklensis TaxID=887465 RepID=A0A9W4GWG9_9ACTN|nr:hypothetical protein [Actinacidiphila cocklensis]MDD1058839.1 hypothetical protein [Actinacidiphila cocklensis]CAG6398968.1 conserved hypothetical protein [Actinacidiphila cocklensis]